MLEGTSEQAKPLRGFSAWRYLEIESEGLKVVRIGNWVLRETEWSGEPEKWAWYWSPILDDTTRILIV
jgi:hypothetical protein